MEPLFDPRTRDNVQHMTLYRCHVPDTANFQTGNHYNCLSGAPKQLEFCQDYVAGFGHDDGVRNIFFFFQKNLKVERSKAITGTVLKPEHFGYMAVIRPNDADGMTNTICWDLSVAMQ